MPTHHENSPLRARIALGLFLLAAAFFVAVTFSPLRSGFADAPSRGPSDVELYRAEVERIHAGATYYDAAAAELPQRGYPTSSIFNWRTPLPVRLIAALPSIGFANAILGALCLMLVCLSFHLLADDGGTSQGLLGVVLLGGALLPCLLGDLVLMSELWAGVLIALSAVCFALEFRGRGVAFAIAALFFRELAAPFCLLCVALAAGNRRYRELAWWTLGLAAYGVFFSFHVAQVWPRLNPQDTAHASGWIRFGGAGFLISTAQMNAYLLLLPQWVTAIYLAGTLLASASWTAARGKVIALAIAEYAIVFSVAGHDFNQYWGSLTAPLFCLAACQAPRVLRQLVQEAFGQRVAAAAGSTPVVA
jgi:hypothetical protein